MVNAGGIVMFFILTTIYFIIISIVAIKNKTPLKIIYFTLILISQFYISYQTSKTICGTPQTKEILIWSFIPWFIIFGGITVLLTVFPGWKSPFSNTFGYLVVKLMGIKTLFNSLLKSNYTSASPQLNTIAEKLLEDNSLLINQFTPNNFNDALQKLRPLLNKNNIELEKQLYRLVKIKDNVSEYIWYMLTGVLTVSMTNIGLVSSKCNKSVAQLKQESEEYKKQLQANNANNVNKKKIYNIRE